MNRELPQGIAEKILDMPEYSHGVNKVKVTIKDKRVFSEVYVAWGREVIKVGKSEVIPFDPLDVTDVWNDL